MNRETKSTVKEYVETLSDDELYHVYSRMREKLSGDLSEAINVMSTNRAMDALLGASRSADEFFQLCDDIEECLRYACRHRGLLGSSAVA